MYNCETYTKPIWNANPVMFESFMPLAQNKIKLLFHADKILHVTDSSQNIVFEEDKDYVLTNGELFIPDGSDIHIMPWNFYNPKEPTPEKFLCSTGGYLHFEEGAGFHPFQYAVSYTHSDLWNGFIPQFNPNRLNRSRRMLMEHKPFTLGFTGDSITYGLNSSGMEGVNLPPHAPVWAKMSADRLREIYGCKINYVNKALNGAASAWGKDTVIDEFKADIPDLLVIAFGMNDASSNVSPEVFIDNIRQIAEKTLSLNHDCEFIFVSTTFPNKLASQFYKDHHTHEPMLIKLADYFGASADTACMSSMHKYLLSRKDYHHMTGNNINHPNDFLARIYAQVLLSCLVPDFNRS